MHLLEIIKSRNGWSNVHHNSALLQSKSANAPIQSNGSNETNCLPVKGSDVNIVTSDGEPDVESYMLKIKNIVNGYKYFPGQLVAAQMSVTYIHYAITAPGKGCGVVGEQGHG